MALLTPSVGTLIGLRDILQGFGGDRAFSLVEFFQDYTGTRHCYFVNSGTTAFYITLQALRAFSGKRKVVLPAYTAPSLVLPIWKAGLEPALAEVSLDTFNLDVERLGGYIDGDTLCVVPVHMFGLPCDMAGVKKAVGNRPIFVVEDAASSLGSEIDGRPTGTFGQVGFYSFNRGKNLSTLAGGCVVTDDPELARAIRAEWEKLPPAGMGTRLAIPAKTLALALAVRPLFYTLLYPLVNRFKYTELHTDFDSYTYTDFQARLGLSLLARAEEEVFKPREKNGLYLYGGLERIEGLRLPRILERSRPVFNQFPILLPDQRTRDELHRAIRGKLGVEVTTLYPEPIHRIYDLGYTPDPFPNATYLAHCLLLIPTHPLVSRALLARVVGFIRDFLGGRR